jgi:hypothetical protein
MHPEISMSKKKEVKFFVEEKNYWRGCKWYESHFVGQAKAYGEASTDYSKYPRFKGISQRMYAIIPQVKLIYILRDPIDRIVAHYIHYYANCRENRSLPEALSHLENNHYIEVSKYYMQLEQYLQYYPEENILILDGDDLKNNRQETLKTVFRFLGVDELFYSPEYTKIFHKSSAKKRKNKIGKYFLDRYFAAQYSSGVSLMRTIDKVRPFIPSMLIQFYKKMTEYPFEWPMLERFLEIRLIECLKEDVEALRKFTNKEFKSWRI